MDTSQLPVLSVTEFNTLVNETISRLFVWVQGEISGYRVSQNKWVTFDIKDQGSKLNCFMTKYQLDQVLEDGMEVKVLGVPRVYVPYGKYSFTVQRVEPVGAGALQRAFELTKAKLEQEGLFAVERKKSVPRFPQTIGLVTSPEAAAYTDFLRILENRWSGVDVIVRPSVVQGNDAPAQLADALNWFNKYQPVDVIVLTRGGGSMEDLQAFNSETVCRAVYASRIPIICGVGHERDTTLAELVADVRASTPSNAAERAVPDKKEVLWQINQSEKTMAQHVSQLIANFNYRLQEAMGRMERQVRGVTTAFQQVAHRLMLSFSDYQNRLQTQTGSVQQLTGRMARSLDAALREAKHRLIEAERFCASLNPRGVLKRGYAIVRQADGKPLTKLSQIKPGLVVQTELSDGAFSSQVLDINKQQASLW